jgi:hypothetical protein
MARNRFAGACYRCGLTVEAGAGHFERRTGAWSVRHHDHSRAPGAVTCAMAKAKAGRVKQADDGHKVEG